jgi:hypothetical protein
MNIINLKLNSAGILAFKTDKKVLYTEVEECYINECLINTLFPLCLVESWTVEKSWLGRIGEKVAVVTGTGERFLGEITSELDKTINVKYHDPDDYCYECYVVVHPTGIEVTHCKNKIHIEEISAEEVERFEKKMKNVPFTNILEMLNENGAINFDPAEIELPKWLNIETVNKITNILKERKNEYYYNEEDNF